MHHLFYILVGLLVYVYLLFPAAMTALGMLRRRRVAGVNTPVVTVLTAAHNELRNISLKIANTLESDYPPDKLTMIVGSDGSDDGTDAVVAACGDVRVRLISTVGRIGKTNTINAICAVAAGEIFVFTDTDVMIEPHAIRIMTDYFDDPRVGAVCARRTDREHGVSGAGLAVQLYNLYEGGIKCGEGVLGRVMGGDGSLYAIRRTLFRELPPNVPDDFVNILRVIEQGYLVRYAQEAVSWDELPRHGGMEFARRRRIAARAWGTLGVMRSLLNPVRFPLACFLLVSHKVIRWFTGYILLALLVLNCTLASDPLLRWSMVGQAVFYSTAVAGYFVSNSPLLKPLRLISHFVLSNIAAMVGIADVMRGRSWRIWEAQRG